MSIKPLDLYCRKKLDEDFVSGAKDFFKGMVTGATDTVKSKFGVKTSEELEKEAEEDYNSWFTSMGFKEVTLSGQEYFKAYILPISSGSNGILFKFSVDPQYLSDVEKGNKEEVEDVNDTPTIVEILLFDIPIDLGTVDALLVDVDSQDIDKIYDLFAKNNARIAPLKSPIKPEVKGTIQAVQSLLQTKHLSMFSTPFTNKDVSMLKSLIQTGNVGKVDYKNWICDLVARGLSTEHINVEYIRKLGKWASYTDMYTQLAKNDRENIKLWGPLSKDINSQIDVEALVKSGEVTKDYQYRMLKWSIFNVLQDWKTYIEKYRGGNI